ncbi:MAG TPA: undecaprenyl-diphosphate phosphatase [Solirubrobacteraceae bacterium]|jgi:undecaprenyl-diphosphatase|nr:undecaprenyl-diphosphate phosphatase [Solirubrobacteraceae bacterium]
MVHAGGNGGKHPGGHTLAGTGKRAPKLPQALALGLLHGPAELLPISSSAHTELIPWLAGWSYTRLDGRTRKTFEVALHVGAGLALSWHMRRELLAETVRLDRRRAALIALSITPPALAGLAFERPIEQQLGGPRSIAAGLAAGAVAMALADARAQRPRAVARTREHADARDGLAFGLAQTAALIPGVSRNGATLTAARARGFRREDAQALSWHAGLPVILGAGALEGAHMLRGGLAREQRPALALGAAGAFVSTLAGARALDRRGRAGRSLAPYAVYRMTLAGLVVARLRRSGTTIAHHL